MPPLRVRSREGRGGDNVRDMGEVSDAGDGTADDRYRRLIEQSGVGLFQTRVDGGIGWLNHAAARLFGFDTPEEFMNEVPDIRDVYVDPSRRDALVQILRRERAVNGFEYEMRRKDGARRWLSITARAMFDGNNELQGFEGTFLDVTERKLLEAAAQAMSSDLEPSEAVARFARVLGRAVPFRQLSLVAIQGDRYQRLVSVSGDPAHESLPAGEWVDLAANPVGECVRTGRPVVVSDTNDEAWALDRVLRDLGVGSYIVLPLSDGSRVTATFNVGFAAPGQIEDDVQDLLQGHTAAVTQAVQNILLFEGQREVVARLEEVARLKNEFLATVSHDLKNPMSVLSGVAEVLQGSWDAIEPERREQMLETLVRSSRTMKDMLQRDLDLALIESGELSYENAAFDLFETVRDVVAGFQDSEPGRAFTLEADPGLPPAMGDRRRQAQILYNLLSNAVKFSPPGAPVTIEVRRSDGMLSVAIVDRGPGIDASDRARLFDRLSRLDTAKPGSGLGLYIARSMVESQGGTIAVVSDPGSGSRFTYTIPAA